MADLTAMMQAAAGAAGGDAIFIEDVFSTYLYTGTGAALTITNDIDLDGEGGLTWIKSRSAATDHQLFDTVRGATNELISNSTAAQAADADTLTAFNADGFSLGADSNVNTSAATYCSWSFRKAPKFFDVVTYTGDGVAGRTVAHNLGSVPGMIIIKRTDTTASWQVYHRSTGNTDGLILNSTAATQAVNWWNNTTPTSTEFTLGSSTGNNSGGTFVAYLFAHDAGGFGTAGTDNVISCGSYTGNGSSTGPIINLGYEAQWLLIKNASSAQDWLVYDNMRGAGSNNTVKLQPNTSNAEDTSGEPISFTATGFQPIGADSEINGNGNTIVYMAIRRPMKVPTTGTSVFEPVTTTAANFIKTTLEAVDMGLFKDAALTSNFFVSDRLRGIMSYYNPTIYTNLTNAEATPTTGDTITSTSSEGTGNGKFYFGGAGSSSDKPTGYAFKRASGFMDVVCYTGTGSLTGVTHNLGVTPELKIIKCRNDSSDWVVGGSIIGEDGYIYLQDNAGKVSSTNYWDGGNDSATIFSVRNTNGNSDFAGYTYVAYLFATCAGVSKVGSYTGTGATQTINAALPTGARFVLIKRTDSTGDWWVWDTARGMVSGTDPRLALNSTAAESNNDWVYTVTNGFQIVTSDATVNASGGNYIYLAIA
jgi:hypothetical protein